jgi:hypothetical protein
MRHQPSDIISLTDDVTTAEETDRQIVSTSSTMTQPLSESSETVIIPINLKEKKPLKIYCFIQNEATSADNQDNEIILQTINELINDIIQSVSSDLQQNSIDTHEEIIPENSGLTRSIIPQVKT